MKDEEYDEAVSLLAEECHKHLGDEATEDDVEEWVRNNWDYYLPPRLEACIYARMDYEHVNNLWEFEYDVSQKLAEVYNY